MSLCNSLHYSRKKVWFNYYQGVFFHKRKVIRIRNSSETVIKGLIFVAFLLKIGIRVFTFFPVFIKPEMMLIYLKFGIISVIHFLVKRYLLTKESRKLYNMGVHTKSIYSVLLSSGKHV